MPFNILNNATTKITVEGSTTDLFTSHSFGRGGRVTQTSHRTETSETRTRLGKVLKNLLCCCCTDSDRKSIDPPHTNEFNPQFRPERPPSLLSTSKTTNDGRCISNVSDPLISESYLVGPNSPFEITWRPSDPEHTSQARLSANSGATDIFSSLGKESWSTHSKSTLSSEISYHPRLTRQKSTDDDGYNTDIDQYVFDPMPKFSETPKFKYALTSELEGALDSLRKVGNGSTGSSTISEKPCHSDIHANHFPEQPIKSGLQTDNEEGYATSSDSEETEESLRTINRIASNLQNSINPPRTNKELAQDFRTNFSIAEASIQALLSIQERYDAWQNRHTQAIVNLLDVTAEACFFEKAWLLPIDDGGWRRQFESPSTFDELRDWDARHKERVEDAKDKDLAERRLCSKWKLLDKEGARLDCIRKARQNELGAQFTMNRVRFPRWALAFQGSAE